MADIENYTIIDYNWRIGKGFFDIIMSPSAEGNRGSRGAFDELSEAN